MAGDVRGLAPLINLTRLDLGLTNVEGNVKGLAPLINLTELSLEDTKVKGRGSYWFKEETQVAIREYLTMGSFRHEKDADSAVEAWASTEESLACTTVTIQENKSATVISIHVLTSKCLFLTKLNIDGCRNVDADVALLGALVNLVELKADRTGLKGERGRAEGRRVEQ